MSLEDNRSLQEVGTGLEQPAEVSTLTSQEAGTELEQPADVSTLTSGTPESSDMSNLLAGMETLSAAPLVAGQVVQGRVLKVADGEVVIDLGLKTEATAPVAEFLNTDGQVGVAPGDTVGIWIEKYDVETGRVEIWHQKAARRKLALEEELNRRKSELAERLIEGAEVVGKVKNLADYGVFVDLGGMDGLLHITDLAWGRVTHPSEVVQVGQEIRVKVLRHDVEKGRVSLGLKQLAPDPWEMVPRTYHAGDRVAGRVVS